MLHHICCERFRVVVLYQDVLGLVQGQLQEYLRYLVVQAPCTFINDLVPREGICTYCPDTPLI